MKSVLILCAVLLAGCDTLQLTNRITIPVACDEVHVESWWWKFAISTPVDKRDAEKILADRCKKS